MGAHSKEPTFGFSSILSIDEVAVTLICPYEPCARLHRRIKAGDSCALRSLVREAQGNLEGKNSFLLVARQRPLVVRLWHLAKENIYKAHLHYHRAGRKGGFGAQSQ